MEPKKITIKINNKARYNNLDEFKRYDTSTLSQPFILNVSAAHRVVSDDVVVVRSAFLTEKTKQRILLH